MAVLTEEQIKQVAAEIQSELSSARVSVTVNKHEFVGLIAMADTALASAEQSLINALSADVQQWITSKMPLARGLLTKIAQRRSELLPPTP